MPGQEIILRLLHNGTNQVQPLSDSPSLGDLLGRPLAGAPIKSPALIDDIIHGPNGLLDGRGGVRAVAIENVEVVHVEPLERGLGALDEVLAGEALVVGAGPTPEDLGGDDDVGALPAQLPYGLAHDLLRPPAGVHLRVVEEVDAVITAALEERLRLLHVQLVAEAHPRPVRQLAHL